LPQGDVRVTSRQENIAGAFYLRRQRAITHQRVILVDDVYTSGSTARECARVLTAGGSDEVTLLTAVRAG
jgi:predicted amidophosphoribosyltransferase